MSTPENPQAPDKKRQEDPSTLRDNEDPTADEAFFLAEAAQYPPLETANLEDGPDEEMFNAGDGFVTTRKEERERRATLEALTKIPPTTLEEARARARQSQERRARWKPESAESPGMD